ncbi:methionyl-tRNA formyltransferase [Sphingobacterium psychroaquaticum]|nr:methionyl-tRNA formyltransferase [Sphingobacterium psychroaquaticum]
MRIIFMGTPDFAVASLQALLNDGAHVVAVVTTPDKPAGRGQKMHESAVKVFAKAHDIPVLQPVKLRDPLFVQELRDLKADLQVVVAFRMLPELVWSMPPKGTINVHASLLPQYRGAAPINHAIINGEEKTGVTTFLLQHEIDTGNILFSEEVDILADDNAGIVHDKLMAAGARTLLKTVKGLEAGTITPIPQADIPVETLHHAPKIFKEDCEINWNQPTEKVYNFIRGLSPYPSAYTHLDQKVLKIYETEKSEKIEGLAPGAYHTDHKNYLAFATANGSIRIKSLQIEGKRRMQIDEFLRGYRFD